MNRIFWIAICVLGAGLVFLLFTEATGSSIGIDSDRFGNVLYLGVLGAVIAAGILRSGRLGETARSLAVWVLIVLLFVAGYQYRYELQDFASRVSGGLVNGSPLSVTDAEGRTTVTLQKRQDGHFVARLSINGQSVDALVDTGATSTVLTFEDAARAGFDTDALRFTIPVSTANGNANAARVVAADISVGAIARRNMPLMVAEDGRLEQSLLGMNFIGSLSGFDVRGDRLILRD